MHIILRLIDPEEANRKMNPYQHTSGVIDVPQKHTSAKQQAGEIRHCHLSRPLENQPGNGLQEWTSRSTLAADFPGSPMHWGWNGCNRTTQQVELVTSQTYRGSRRPAVSFPYGHFHHGHPSGQHTHSLASKYAFCLMLLKVTMDPIFWTSAYCHIFLSPSVIMNCMILTHTRKDEYVFKLYSTE